MSMAEYEPASGYNMPPGCFEEDIDCDACLQDCYCVECKHCIESHVLDCCICAPTLADAVAKLKGTQRWSPRCILAAVEDAVVDESDCCAEFEE